MKLRGRKTIVGLFFFLLNDDDVVSFKDEELDLGTSWGGKIGEEGGYNIVGDQVSQEVIKSTHVLKER